MGMNPMAPRDIQVHHPTSCWPDESMRPPQELILAVPPLLPSGPSAPRLGAEHWVELRDTVDLFSVMT